MPYYDLYEKMTRCQLKTDKTLRNIEQLSSIDCSICNIAVRTKTIDDGNVRMSGLCVVETFRHVSAN